MTVSIVVPILTRQHLRGFFDSLLAEGLRDFKAPVEVIIIDNGCEDAALGWGARLQTKVVYHDPSVGFHTGWNEGVRLASGDVVIVVNDDVLWGPRAVRNFVDALTRFDLLCCYPTPTETAAGLQLPRIVAESREPPRLVGPPEFRGWCHAWHAARLALPALPPGTGLFDERYELFYGDDDAWMQTISFGRPARQVHNAFLYHLESQSVKTLPKEYVVSAKARDAARFREKWGKTPRELLCEKGLV